MNTSQHDSDILKFDAETALGKLRQQYDLMKSDIGRLIEHVRQQDRRIADLEKDVRGLQSLVEAEVKKQLGASHDQ